MSHVNNSRQSQQGFTIIELTMAMTFVSILLLSIALAVIQIGNIYNKGLTMRAVDHAGRAISLDIRQTLSKSEPFDVSTALRFQNYPGGGSDGPDGGRLCTGAYSYIWNAGRSMDNPINKYSSSDGGEIRFAKVRDPGGDYCANLARNIQQDNATELLASGDRDLAIQSLEIVRLVDDPSTGQALYRVVMMIGTNNRDALMQDENINSITECKPPSEEGSLQDYCAVNRFEFTVQAGNGGGV